MEKVRIGNDVKLLISIPKLQLANIDDVRDLRIYLINKTVDDCFLQGVCDIRSNVLHLCGRPDYHVLPYGQIPEEYGYPFDFIPHDGRPFIPPYVYSSNAIKYDNPNIIGPYSKYKGPWHMFDPLHKHLIVSKLLQDKTVEAYFPAISLWDAGEYKAVATFTLFENGYGHRNLHTYTVDLGDVLELVLDGGKTGEVEIHAGEVVKHKFKVKVYIAYHGSSQFDYCDVLFIDETGNILSIRTDDLGQAVLNDVPEGTYTVKMIPQEWLVPAEVTNFVVDKDTYFLYDDIYDDDTYISYVALYHKDSVIDDISIDEHKLNYQVKTSLLDGSNIIEAVNKEEFNPMLAPAKYRLWVLLPEGKQLEYVKQNESGYNLIMLQSELNPNLYYSNSVVDYYDQPKNYYYIKIK